MILWGLYTAGSCFQLVVSSQLVRTAFECICFAINECSKAKAGFVYFASLVHKALSMKLGLKSKSDLGRVLSLTDNHVKLTTSYPPATASRRPSVIMLLHNFWDCFFLKHHPLPWVAGGEADQRDAKLQDHRAWKHQICDLLFLFLLVEWPSSCLRFCVSTCFPGVKTT